MPNIIEITDFHAPELDPYARLTQNQLRNRLRKASSSPRAPRSSTGRWTQATSPCPC